LVLRMKGLSMCKCTSCQMGLPNCHGSDVENPLLVCMPCIRKQDYKMAANGWKMVAYCDRCREYGPLYERKIEVKK
jgi:hypothetical protein